MRIKTQCKEKIFIEGFLLLKKSSFVQAFPWHVFLACIKTSEKNSSEKLINWKENENLCNKQDEKNMSIKFLRTHLHTRNEYELWTDYGWWIKKIWEQFYKNFVEIEQKKNMRKLFIKKRTKWDIYRPEKSNQIMLHCYIEESKIR